MATMTFNITEKEMTVLAQLAEAKGLTKTATLRQALRLYQMIDARISAGERLTFSGDKGMLYEGFIIT